MTEEEQEKIAHRIIDEAGRLDLKQTLEGFDKEVYENTRNIIPLWLKQSLRVAAIMVLAFGVYHFGFNSQQSTEELFDSYYTVYDAPGVTRGEGTQHENWQKAIDYYSAKNFREAKTYFEKAQDEVPDYQLSFYKSSAFLAMSNIEDALSGFNVVLETDNDYNQQARWYKALSLIKLERIDEAKAILMNIISKESYNHEKAKQILKQLD